ncbi:MAG: hypothetical protein K2J80_12475 [Oscillospiraceae bacterium]|nr:hypothetical protein [Oscillospiraceae bacterium]
MKKYNDKDKLNAIATLHKAANLFEKYFCHKKLLVIHNNLISPHCIEVSSEPTGFLHLTGLIVNKNSLFRDISDKDANFRRVFYEKCLDGRITINDFDFDSKGEAELKLKVIVNTLTPRSNAKMLGDYNGQRLYFKSHKLMGSESSYLGLFKDEKGYYAVSSVMNDDIRNNVEHIGISPVTSKIFMILSKGFSEECYNEIICISKYKGKKIDIHDLLEKVSKDFAISPELLSPTDQGEPPLSKKTIEGNDEKTDDKDFATSPELLLLSKQEEPPLNNIAIEENDDNSDNKKHKENNEITDVSEMPEPQSSNKTEATKKRLTLDEHLAQARAAKQTEPISLPKNEQSKSKKHEESL